MQTIAFGMTAAVLTGLAGPALADPTVDIGAFAGDAGVGTYASVTGVDFASLDYGYRYDHNKSVVVVIPERGLIVYAEPKKAIRDVARPGSFLFVGEPWSAQEAETAVIRGRAFAFKKGCKPAVYRVEGGYSSVEGIWSFSLDAIEGAPVWEKGGCAVTGYSASSANAHLKFTGAWE